MEAHDRQKDLDAADSPRVAVDSDCLPAVRTHGGANVLHGIPGPLGWSRKTWRSRPVLSIAPAGFHTGLRNLGIPGKAIRYQ